MEKNNQLLENDAKKKKEINIEILVVILLGITALCTAWASWIGSLHGGNQATNYTVSNNLASEGNSEYNSGVQQMMQDMLLWSEISDLQIDVFFAQSSENDEELSKSANKLFFKLNDNLSETMATAIGWDWDYVSDDPTEIVERWLEKEEAVISPFTDEVFITTYFESANRLLLESAEKLEEGQRDNKNGDALGLVTVIYSVVLFLLGISSSFKNQKNQYALVIISTVSFIIATIYLLNIPLPTGFDLFGFFAS